MILSLHLLTFLWLIFLLDLHRVTTLCMNENYMHGPRVRPQKQSIIMSHEVVLLKWGLRSSAGHCQLFEYHPGARTLQSLTIILFRFDCA